MDKHKRAALAAAGWQVGDAQEFLELSEVERRLVELKLALSDAVRGRRRAKRLTQVRFAKRLGSSQSRVAKIERGDPSVSLDLLVKALLTLGADPATIAEGLSARTRSKK